MTETIVNIEVAEEEAVKSNPFATVWLVVLGVLLGVTLFFSAVLMAWPIVARFAATLR